MHKVLKEKTRSISTWHSYIQEQENRPGYARKNTPEITSHTLAQNMGSPIGLLFDSPLIEKDEKKKKRDRREKGRIEGRSKEMANPPTPKAQYRPFSPWKKARASTAAMKRESYTCKKVMLPPLYV